MDGNEGAAERGRSLVVAYSHQLQGKVCPHPIPMVDRKGQPGAGPLPPRCTRAVIRQQSLESAPTELFPWRRFNLMKEGFNTMTDTSTSTVLAQLVARSRKLGADRSICNWGGGNTSAKADEVNFRGRPARILWVKGSGSDLASVTEASFTGLYMDDVLPLVERERMSDSEMVDYLAHCFYEPGRPRPSIETLLHGFLPFAHIDHTHADATHYSPCAVAPQPLPPA